MLSPQTLLERWRQYHLCEKSSKQGAVRVKTLSGKDRLPGPPPAAPGRKDNGNQDR
jgi:hypothetical protein